MMENFFSFLLILSEFLNQDILKFWRRSYCVIAFLFMIIFSKKCVWFGRCVRWARGTVPRRPNCWSWTLMRKWSSRRHFVCTQQEPRTGLPSVCVVCTLHSSQLWRRSCSIEQFIFAIIKLLVRLGPGFPSPAQIYIYY